MRFLIVIVVAAVALAACGPSARIDREGQVTVRGADGLLITASKQVPATLPIYATPYPGSQVTSAVVMGDKGGIVTYVVAAPTVTVTAYHMQAAKNARLTATVDSWGPGAVQRSASRVISYRDDAGREGYTLTVQPMGGKTQVTLLYGG
jgi:hypothetical protein